MPKCQNKLHIPKNKKYGKFFYRNSGGGNNLALKMPSVQKYFKKFEKRVCAY